MLNQPQIIITLTTPSQIYNFTLLKFKIQILYCIIICQFKSFFIYVRFSYIHPILYILKFQLCVFSFISFEDKRIHWFYYWSTVGCGVILLISIVIFYSMLRIFVSVKRKRKKREKENLLFFFMSLKDKTFIILHIYTVGMYNVSMKIT